LLKQGRLAAIQIASASPILRQGNDPAQVGVGETLDLLRHGRSAALEVLPPRLQLLWQPAASRGSLQRLGHTIGLLQQLRQIVPDERVQCVGANEPGLASRSGATTDLMGLARAQVVPLAARHSSGHAGQGDFDELRNFEGLGRLLIALRVFQGLSQRELAEKLSVHESQVSRDERNEYHGVTVERANRILEALGAELRTTIVTTPHRSSTTPKIESVLVGN
jgi:hypothetical protein